MLPKNPREPLEIGRTVALTACPAYMADGKIQPISGLYHIVEFHPYEPSAYVWNACFSVAPEGDFTEEGVVTVDADTLWEQVEPSSYGAMLRAERDLAHAMDLEPLR
jgi:hypothetical protein